MSESAMTTEILVDGKAAQAEVFSFGDPEAVLDRREVMNYVECWTCGRWYAPPISLDGLSRTFKAAPHHSSAIMVKVNLLAKTFIPHARLSRAEFRAVALDFCTLANGYLERRMSVTGKALEYKRSPAKFTRRGVEPETFFFLNGDPERWGWRDSGWGLEHEFAKGSVYQLAEPSLDQEIYGVPHYLSALQAAWLNEAATIFRRRYYLNGSHAGFILYSTDAGLPQDDVDALREALKSAKGPGNFRNLFLHAPGGKEKGLQLIPVGEVAAKDDFLNIKNVSRDDVLAAHRVPPQLMGVVPQVGGFGDVGKATDAFVAMEIEPLQTQFLGFNDWAGEELIRFTEWKPMTKSANDNAGAPAAAAA